MTINMHERIFLSGSGRLLDLFPLLPLSVRKWAFLSLYPHSCSTSSLRQSTQGPILLVFMILFYFLSSRVAKVNFTNAWNFLRRVRKKQQQGFLTQYICVQTEPVNKGQAYHHQLPGPTYAPGQKVWLSTKHLPVCTEEHFHWPFGTSDNNKSFYSLSEPKMCLQHNAVVSVLDAVCTSPSCPRPFVQ